MSTAALTKPERSAPGNAAPAPVTRLHPAAAASASWNLEAVVSGLRNVRERWRLAQQRQREWGGRELPSREALGAVVAGLCGALFPMRLGPAELRQENEDFYGGHTLDAALHGLAEQVALELDYQQRHGRPDVVVTDPPRAGMHEKAVRFLLDLAAPRIVYVSCNPATQARDLALLSEKYRVLKMRPVDMFPHTHHIENVALMELIG